MAKEQTTHWQALNYATLSAKSVEFANRFNQQSVKQMELMVGTQLHSVRIETAIQVSEFPIVLNCRIAEHELRVGLDTSLATLLMNEWLVPKDLLRLPDDLKVAVAEASLQTTVDYFKGKNGHSFKVEKVEGTSTAAPDDSLFFSLVSPSGEVVGHGFVESDAPLIESLLSNLQQAAPQAHAVAGHKQWGVAVDIEVGYAKLPLAEFRGLGAGDIIFLDRSLADSDTVYARISPSICFACELDGNHLIVRKREEEEDDGR